MSDIARRDPRRPIITADDLPYPATSVFNPGVAEVDGEVLLLLRVEDLSGVSHLLVARSKNGVDNWRFGAEPLIRPGHPDRPEEAWGCEDPRVTQIGERHWVICYTAYSSDGAAIALAHTRDFETVDRIGVVLPPWNKGGAVLPEQINGRWFMLHRPPSEGGEHIWYAWSEDLSHWDEQGPLMEQRGGLFWDGVKIGAGPPPIKTKYGWLLVYHGVKQLVGLSVYRLGVALLDADDPRIVRARASEHILGPRESYERIADAPNVIYSCGALLRGDEVWIYYGAGDTCVARAIVPLPSILNLLEQADAKPS